MAEKLSCTLSRRDLVVSLFERLDTRGIRYVALHSYETLPDDLPSDLDLAVHPEDTNKLPDVFAALRLQGYQVVQCMNYAVAGYYFVFLWPEADGLRSLAVDFTFQHREGGRIAMDGAELVTGRVRRRGFWIARPETEFGYLLCKKTLKGDLPGRQGARLSALITEMGRPAAEAVAARWFGKIAGIEVVDACLAGQMGARMPELRKQFLGTMFRRDPLNGVRHHLTELPRMARRWISPIGLSIAVLGPDGAGKSTLVNELVRQIQPAFRSTRVYHWRPYVLRGRRRTIASDPHREPADATPCSSLRLMGHLLDYWLGYAFRIRPVTARAGLVVFDRYFHDLLADPKRYRYGGPPWLVRLTGHLVAAPDLVLILDAPEAVVIARKQELSCEEIARQREVYRQLAGAFPKTEVLNAAGASGDVARRACEAVLSVMLSRLSEPAECLGFRDGGDAGVLQDALDRVQDSPPAGGRAHSFLVMPSRRDPRLLAPLDNSRAARKALEIYTPYRAKARALKGALGLAIHCGAKFLAGPHLSLLKGSLAGLESLVRETTGERSPLFAFSIGTPGYARKFTIQAMRPCGEILGYIKVPMTDAAGERVTHEAATLARLNRVHGLRPYLPMILFAGEWHGQTILFQSAGHGRPGPSRFSGLHTQFLQDLRRATTIKRSGSALVKEVAGKWEAAAPDLSRDWRDLGRDALRIARRELRGAEVVCGLSHGDFAPWNTRVRDGRLFVFDWESAEWDAPVWWDLFHFDLQVSSLLRQKSGIDMSRVDAPVWNGLYLLYMLRSVLRCKEDGAAAEALEFRREKLHSLMAGKPQLKVLEAVHVGSRY